MDTPEMLAQRWNNTGAMPLVYWSVLPVERSRDVTDPDIVCDWSGKFISFNDVPKI